jgi:hypothetical protein
MVATVQQLIGKINPWNYAENGKELLKEYGSPEEIPAEKVKPVPVRYELKDGVMKVGKGLNATHNLIYDSSSETLEPIYFFILDLIRENGLSVKKYVDNFSSSPGSGHFAELGQRATIMQQQGTKLLGDVNTVLRSVLNIIYDLREFNIRLQHYQNLNSKEEKVREGAILTLKQLWMDKVDILKGNSSIKAMALGQVGYQTLIDAFLVAKDEKDVEKLDLNERVKRILLSRVQEYNIWLKQSEKELTKRYELEKTYLKSQVNSLKLYSRWAKPYLRAAQQLESTEASTAPELVKVFNTIILELSLMATSKLKIDDVILEGFLPKDFKKIKLKRDYNQCILVNFKFRGIPQKVSQQSHFAFGGRAEIAFSAYALNDEELKKLEELLEESDIEDAFKLIEGTTEESVSQLKEDIDFFLKDMPDEEEKEKKFRDTSNPFLALVGAYDKKEKKKTKKEKKGESSSEPLVVRRDDYVEKNYLRIVSAEKAVNTTFNLFNVYKKAHGMASYI